MTLPDSERAAQRYSSQLTASKTCSSSRVGLLLCSANKSCAVISATMGGIHVVGR